MNKKEKKEKAPCINLGLLATLFNTKRNCLYFGIAETILDDCECVNIPIVIIKGKTDEYIDLTTGFRKKTAYAMGLKENMYKACVLYNSDRECFQFSIKDATCFVSKKNLVNIFGAKIIKQNY